MFGDDPTVLELEEEVAALAGKEAALFIPSGTMSNQIALRLHAGGLDEVRKRRAHPQTQAYIPEGSHTRAL